MAKHKRQNGEHVGRFVALEHFMKRTEAWRSLTCTERCVYTEVKARYNGSNNGRIGCSLLELAKELHIGKATAMRALETLEERGFLAKTKGGFFEVKSGDGRSAEWRLTEHRCDVTHALPTKDFTRWHDLKKQKPVSPQNPPGFSHETERVST